MKPPAKEYHDKLSIGARLVRGSFMRVLLSVAGAIVGFFMMPFMVSHLGDYWYGLWIAIGSLVNNLYLLDFGLTTGVVRFVSAALSKNDIDTANRVISTAFWIFCLLTLLVIVITHLMAVLAVPILGIPEDSPVPIIIVILGMSLAVGFPLNAMAGVIHARLRYDLLILKNVALLAASTGLTVYLLRNGHGVIALAIVGLLLNIVSDVLYFLIARSVFPQLEIGWRYFTPDLVRELFSFSMWVFVANISNQIRLRIDALVVARVQSAVAVTYYSVGARPSEIADQLLMRATNVVQPVLIRYHATGDHSRLSWSLIIMTKIHVVIGTFIGGMLLILGEPFIIRWMGERFADSAPVLYVISVALNIGFIVHPLYDLLYTIRLPRFPAIVSVGDAVANLGLSIWLGSWLGLVGVAWGTLIPMAISRFFLIVPYACRHGGLSVASYAASIVRAAAPAALVLVPTALVAKPFLSGSGYGTFTVIVLAAGIIYAPMAFYGAFNSLERAQFINIIWRARPAAVAA
jgi:O-antigen/teichoic acid export membrane protein